mmetsp:Transcript_44666/g.136244  ORF Transcript_44666/g.136244 Transcript_44666/m.136244 type:complete len:218 (+) Transcript_44666:364-1017(+)
MQMGIPPFQSLYQISQRRILVPVHHHAIEVASRSAVFHLFGSICGSYPYRLLALSAPSPQSRLQLLHRRWGNEHVIRIQVGRLHSSDALNVNVEDADAPCILHGLDRVEAGAVEVAMNFCMFDEFPCFDLGRHVLAVREVVVRPIDLARSRASCCVRHAKSKVRVAAVAAAVIFGVVSQEHIDEGTLAHTRWPSYNNRAWPQSTFCLPSFSPSLNNI